MSIAGLEGLSLPPPPKIERDRLLPKPKTALRRTLGSLSTEKIGPEIPAELIVRPIPSPVLTKSNYKGGISFGVSTKSLACGKITAPEKTNHFSPDLSDFCSTSIDGRLTISKTISLSTNSLSSMARPQGQLQNLKGRQSKNMIVSSHNIKSENHSTGSKSNNINCCNPVRYNNDYVNSVARYLPVNSTTVPFKGQYVNNLEGVTYYPSPFTEINNESTPNKAEQIESNKTEKESKDLYSEDDSIVDSEESSNKKRQKSSANNGSNIKQTKQTVISMVKQQNAFINSTPIANNGNISRYRAYPDCQLFMLPKTDKQILQTYGTVAADKLRGFERALKNVKLHYLNEAQEPKQDIVENTDIVQNTVILRGGYSDFKREFERRGWIVNPNTTSWDMNIKFTIKSSEITHENMLPWQYGNHFGAKSSLTTKAGLIRTLVENPVDIPIELFFPQAFRLNQQTKLYTKPKQVAGDSSDVMSTNSNTYSDGQQPLIPSSTIENPADESMRFLKRFLDLECLKIVNLVATKKIDKRYTVSQIMLAIQHIRWFLAFNVFHEDIGLNCSDSYECKLLSSMNYDADYKTEEAKIKKTKIIIPPEPLLQEEILVILPSLNKFATLFKMPSYEEIRSLNLYKIYISLAEKQILKNSEKNNQETQPTFEAELIEYSKILVEAVSEFEQNNSESKRLENECKQLVDLFIKNDRQPNIISNCSNIWVAKPTGKSRGRGIFVSNNLEELLQPVHHFIEDIIKGGKKNNKKKSKDANNSPGTPITEKKKRYNGDSKSKIPIVDSDQDNTSTDYPTTDYDNDNYGDNYVNSINDSSDYGTEDDDHAPQHLSDINTNTEKYVIQKYHENPLLLGEYKFDIRQWVLVSSVSPLIIWQYSEPYLRFCSEKYKANNDEFSPYAHLSNNSIQKKSTDFSNEADDYLKDGNMWYFDRFRKVIEENSEYKANNTFYKSYFCNGNKNDEHEAETIVDRINDDMARIIISTIQAARFDLEKTPNSFELYGYDFLIDSDMRPWLLEVNSSPTLEKATDIVIDLIRDMCKGAISILVDAKMGTLTKTKGDCEILPKISNFAKAFKFAYENNKFEPIKPDIINNSPDTISKRIIGNWRLIYHENMAPSVSRIGLSDLVVKSSPLSIVNFSNNNSN